MSNTSRLRRLLKEEEIVIAPGAYDCLTAKIVQAAGFPAVYMTGYGTAAALLGKPDVGLVSMSEMLDNARRIVNTIDIPLIADADTGYGNPINVTRTIREYEAAGVAACHIEDQVWPKRCGHMEGKRVIPKEEMVQKIKAALQARRDQDFIIIARSDAIRVSGLEDALERGKAYAQAGADALFFDAPRSLEDVKAIARSFDVPLLFNKTASGKSPSPTIAELKQLGFKIVIFPAQALYTACRAVMRLMGEIKQTGTVAFSPDKMTTFDEFNQFIGLPEIQALEKEFGSEG